jgi:hypothetical protein
MYYFIALLLLIAPISTSTQNEGQSVAQSNKPSTARHEKIVTQPAAPKASESKGDEPSIEYNQSYYEDISKPAKQAHDAIDLLNALSTAVVSAFTVVLAIVAYRQYAATRIAERAWVVSQAPDPPPTNPEGDVAIRWVVENRGRTPAWVTSLGSAARIIKARDELPENPPYTMAGPFTREGTVLPPKAKASRGVTIPAAKMAAVEHGYEGKEYALYVFGIVEYRDIFGSKHETRYCYRFKPGPTEADPAPRDFYVDGPSSYSRAT